MRPGSPFLYSIRATGDRPMTFAADCLPDGLKLDLTTGRITGKLNTPGEHKVTLRAKNALGSAEKPLRIVLRDLWRQKDLGTFDASFAATVRPHGVVLVRVAAAT